MVSSTPCRLSRLMRSRSSGASLTTARHRPPDAPLADLHIKLTPGAASDRIDGWDVDPDGRPILKVRVRARPIEGEANAALLKLIAKTLNVPKSAVSLERGGQSRVKRIAVDGLSPDEVRARLSGQG